MSLLAHYEAWLEKKPGDRMALYGVAFELKKAGDFEGACAAFEVLLALHPTSGAGWFQLGQMFEEDGDEERAVATLERGLEALAGATDANSTRSRVEIRAALDALI